MQRAKKQEWSFEWLKYIINLHAGRTSSSEEKHKEKSNCLKLEISSLECSEQSRELQTFRVLWLLRTTVALEGHGKSWAWYFLCKIILECTKKLGPCLSCQSRALGQSCSPVPSSPQSCCSSTGSAGLCGQAAAAATAGPPGSRQGSFPTHKGEHQVVHTQGGICKSSHCQTGSASFGIGSLTNSTCSVGPMVKALKTTLYKCEKHDRIKPETQCIASSHLLCFPTSQFNSPVDAA